MSHAIFDMTAAFEHHYGFISRRKAPDMRKNAASPMPATALGRLVRRIGS
jgi:hypothetical protein